jgi:hypothetical protein
VHAAHQLLGCAAFDHQQPAYLQAYQAVTDTASFIRGDLPANERDALARYTRQLLHLQEDETINDFIPISARDDPQDFVVDNPFCLDAIYVASAAA